MHYFVFFFKLTNLILTYFDVFWCLDLELCKEKKLFLKTFKSLFNFPGELRSYERP